MDLEPNYLLKIKFDKSLINCTKDNADKIKLKHKDNSQIALDGKRPDITSGQALHKFGQALHSPSPYVPSKVLAFMVHAADTGSDKVRTDLYDLLQKSVPFEKNLKCHQACDFLFSAHAFLIKKLGLQRSGRCFVELSKHLSDLSEIPFAEQRSLIVDLLDVLDSVLQALSSLSTLVITAAIYQQIEHDFRWQLKRAYVVFSSVIEASRKTVQTESEVETLETLLRNLAHLNKQVEACDDSIELVSTDAPVYPKLVKKQAVQTVDLLAISEFEETNEENPISSSIHPDLAGLSLDSATCFSQQPQQFKTEPPKPQQNPRRYQVLEQYESSQPLKPMTNALPMVSFVYPPVYVWTPVVMPTALNQYMPPR